MEVMSADGGRRDSCAGQLEGVLLFPLLPLYLSIDSIRLNPKVILDPNLPLRHRPCPCPSPTVPKLHPPLPIHHTIQLQLREPLLTAPAPTIAQPSRKRLQRIRYPLTPFIVVVGGGSTVLRVVRARRGAGDDVAEQRA